MLKNKKCVIGLIAVVMLVAAAVAAVVIYRKQIGSFFSGVKEKLPCCKKPFTPEECEDFADI